MPWPSKLEVRPIFSGGASHSGARKLCAQWPAEYPNGTTGWVHAGRGVRRWTLVQDIWNHIQQWQRKRNTDLFFFVMAMALAIRSYLNLSLAFLWCTFSFPADTSIKDFWCYWFWPQKKICKEVIQPICRPMEWRWLIASQVRRGLAAVCSISSWAAQDIKSHTAQTAELFNFRSCGLRSLFLKEHLEIWVFQI